MNDRPKTHIHRDHLGLEVLVTSYLHVSVELVYLIVWLFALDLNCHIVDIERSTVLQHNKININIIRSRKHCWYILCWIIFRQSWQASFENITHLFRFPKIPVPGYIQKWPKNQKSTELRSGISTKPDSILIKERDAHIHFAQNP